VEVIDQSHAAAQDPAAMSGIVQDALAIGHPVTAVGPDGKATPITAVDPALADGIAKGTHSIEIGPRPGEAAAPTPAATDNAMKSRRERSATASCSFSESRLSFIAPLSSWEVS
jgi:hypothetical protein